MVLLTFIYVATTVFIWRSGEKTAKIANKQLEEMAIERLNRGQPFLVASDLSFIIDKPRFFYSPPKDEHEFLSRYHLSATIVNLSDDPALFVDYFACLNMPCDGGEIVIKTCADRRNYISNNISDTSQDRSLMFVDDSDAMLFSSLRQQSSITRPRLELVMYYKNSSGAYYKVVNQYYLVFKKDDEKIISDWHVAIVQAPVKYQEELKSVIKLKSNSDNEKWNKLFSVIKNDFWDSCDQTESISLRLVDIPKKYELKQINESEYLEAEIKYGHFMRIKDDESPKEKFPVVAMKTI